MELEMPDKTTQDFDGPGMASRVDPVLGMGINDDDEDENDITFSTMEPIASPYLQYEQGAGNGAGGEQAAPLRKSKKEGKGRSRRDGGDDEESKSNQSSSRSRK